MLTRVKLMSIVCCMLCWLISWSQPRDYHLQLFDHKSGIQAGTITALTTDQQGFLWILYPRQVQCFNGKKLESFKLPVSSNRLFCDAQNRIWVSSNHHLFLYSTQQRRFIETGIEGIDSTDYLGDLFQLHNQTASLLTSKGLFQYDEATKKFKASPVRLPIAGPISVRVFASKDGVIYFRKANTLFRYQFSNGRVDSLPDRNAMRIFALTPDSLLVTTWDNTSYWYHFPTAAVNQIFLPSGLSSLESGSFGVRAVGFIRPGTYLFASREGIFEYNLAARKLSRPRFFLNGRKIGTNDFANYLHIDAHRFVWLANIDGIGRFSADRQTIGLIRLRKLDDEKPVGIDNIRKITEDREGNLWIATGHGLACRNKASAEWMYFPPDLKATNKLNYPSIRGLVYDGKKLIIAPTDRGIWLMNPTTFQYERPFYANDSVRVLSEQDFYDDLYTLQDGNHLLAGRDGLYLLNGKSYLLSKLDIPPSRENSNYIVQSPNGIIWITTQKGLHCLDSNLNYIGEIALPFQDKFISCTYALKDNSLLFGCSAGLYTVKLEKGQAVIQPFSSLFQDIIVTTLYQDSIGAIWASSEKGIYRYDPANSSLNLFDQSDNVQGFGFNGNSWWRSRDGTLYLGGTNGMNYFHPEKFDISGEELSVYLRQVRFGSTDSLFHDFNKSLQLQYKDRDLEIEWSAPYYNSPLNVYYRYRLTTEEPWKEIGNSNLVRISSLSPGHYQFELEASLNKVNWIKAQQVFSFSIHEPFWLSIWFITSVLAVAVFLVWLLLHNRNKKLEAKQEELEAQQAIHFFATSMNEYAAVDPMLWDVARNCIGQLKFEDCVIYLLDEERNVLIQKAAYGPKSGLGNQILSPIEIPVGSGITGAVAASGLAEIISDTSKDNRYIPDDKHRLSELTVPIIADGKVLGVIDSEHSKKGFFTQKHLSILTTIASLCANKIIKARAEQERQLAEKTLMDTRKKMADIEMQALRAQMNPHFIFNCLNSINRYIVKSDQVTASLYLTRFAKLIRLILDNSNNRSITLSNELEALQLYLEMESIRFEKQFNYQICLAEGLQPDTIYVPPLIIQPYVENAIWHGLLHLDKPGELKIELRLTGSNLLECCIEDNGIGREKAAVLKSKSAATKKSLGMRLTEDRLALLNKEEGVQASVEVKDLLEDGRSLGTQVILKIPIDD